MKHIFLWILLPLFQIQLSGQTITVPTDHFSIDTEKKMIVINQSVNIINSNHPQAKQTLYLDANYQLTSSVNEFATGQSYLVKNQITNTEFALYFTQLPIIKIDCDTEIPDEPRVLSHFTMVESNGNKTDSKLGIEVRGGSSQSYPKKSYRIEFWADDKGEETLDYQLLGMRSDDDWNLQAMYNEPLRLRNKTSFELWREINTLYYQSSEPEAINGVRMEYAELFLNSSYKGIYAVGERIDRKQLKLKKHNGKIRGELYKGVSWGAPTFTDLPPFKNGDVRWSGFEYDYPDEIAPQWNNLFGFVDFVINAENNVFYANYKSKVQPDNAVDYYIFLNLLNAVDNAGKNIYTARYNANEPYFFVPWDLDGVFGRYYDGSRYDSVTMQLSNGLYNRLWEDRATDGFYAKIKQRWSDLRKTVITPESIYNRFFEHYSYLKQNGTYEREKLAWKNYVFDENELNYILDWTERRIAYLDKLFALNDDTQVPSISKQNIKIYPNPVTDLLWVEVEENADLIISIYSMTGQLLIQQPIQHQSFISLKNLSQGIYFYRIESSNASYSGKIIKK
ncbi:MAG: CotH kinase family protein [Tannerella sp.]|jgi:hypothetical protein|nr:CotH kinase family protein [Tannerella sp.]